MRHDLVTMVVLVTLDSTIQGHWVTICNGESFIRLLIRCFGTSKWHTASCSVAKCYNNKAWVTMGQSKTTKGQ